MFNLVLVIIRGLISLEIENLIPSSDCNNGGWVWGVGRESLNVIFSHSKQNKKQKQTRGQKIRKMKENERLILQIFQRYWFLRVNSELIW